MDRRVIRLALLALLLVGCTLPDQWLGPVLLPLANGAPVRIDGVTVPPRAVTLGDVLATEGP